MSVPLLFNTNNTFQWLKGEAEGGKKELELKEGRQGENSKKLSGAQKLRLGLCLSVPLNTFTVSYRSDRGRSMTLLGIQTL